MFQIDNFKRLLFIGIGIVGMHLLINSVALGLPGGTERVSGEDRYQTAIAISQKEWTTSQYVVLARGDEFADALCAGPLAHEYHAPILLTKPAALPAEVLTELTRLKAANIFIIGGPEVISPEIENTLRSIGIQHIERLYGQDRYETSAKIAEKISKSDKVVITSGRNYPDALSISVIASVFKMPILLANENILSPKVVDYLQNQQVKTTYIIGGPEMLHPSLDRIVPGPIRLGGIDRYDTNIKVMKYFQEQLNYDKIYMAVGDEFADALTGAVLSANFSSPLFLVNTPLSPATSSFLKEKLTMSSKIIGLGGENVIPASLFEDIASYKEYENGLLKFDKVGFYGPDQGRRVIDGSVYVCSEGVTLQNLIIKGNLIISESIGTGDVVIKNVTIKNRTIVHGGGEHSITFYDSESPTLVIDLPDTWQERVRVIAQGLTRIDKVLIESECTLEEFGLQGLGFGEVYFSRGVPVKLIGHFPRAEIHGTHASVTIPKGSIIQKLLVHSPSQVLGEGMIYTAQINADNCIIEPIPKETRIQEGVAALVGGYVLTNDDAVPVFSGTPQTSNKTKESEIIPYHITSIHFNTEDGYYNVGDVIEIHVSLNGAVEVSGVPVLHLETGEIDRTAEYSQGSGSAELLFTYRVQEGDVSSDLGYRDEFALDLDHGSILNINTNVNALVTLPLPSEPGSLGADQNIVIDTLHPHAIHIDLKNNIPSSGSATLTSVDDPLQDQSWLNILDEIKENTGKGGNWITGIEAENLVIEPSSDGLTAILSNQDRNDAILSSDFFIPAAGVMDRAGNCAMEDIVVNAYHNSSVSAVYSKTADGYYKAGEKVLIQVQFSEAVDVSGTPLLHLETGSTDRSAVYVSGSGTRELTFEYTIEPDDVSEDLEYRNTNAIDLNEGAIWIAGSNMSAELVLPTPGEVGSLSYSKKIVIDTISPSAINFSTQNKILGNSSITVTVENGPLQDSSWAEILSHIQLHTESGHHWITGISPNDLTVTPASDGITAVLHNTSLNPALIKEDLIIPSEIIIDKAGNSPSENILIDSYYEMVTVTEVSSSTQNGFYKAGTSIPITVTCSRPVKVTGIPSLQLNTGVINQHARYASGSGTNIITFVYTVQADDNSYDLDYTGQNALTLQGGSIKEVSNSRDVDLTLPAPGEAQSLSYAKNLVIDTTPPDQILVSAQNTIPKKGNIVLTAQEGPLTTTSWINIYNEIRNNMKVGKWVRNIGYQDMSITPSDDGQTALLSNNHTSSDAVIVGDFIIPSSKVIDKAGNMALKEITINVFQE